MANDWDDRHALLLQEFTNRKLINETDFTELLQHLHITQSPAQIVSLINRKLEFMQLAIKRARDETDGTPFFVFVNLTSDAVATSSSAHTAAEISFFKAIIEGIVSNKDKVITKTQAVNLLRPPTKAEALLARFVQDMWFKESKRRDHEKRRDHVFISLGIRTIVELKNYLKDLNAVKECSLCHEHVVKAFTCNNPECESCLDENCKNNWCQERGNRTPCPVCQTPWGN